MARVFRPGSFRIPSMPSTEPAPTEGHRGRCFPNTLGRVSSPPRVGGTLEWEASGAWAAPGQDEPVRALPHRHAHSGGAGVGQGWGRGRASAPRPFSRLLFPREVALGAPGLYLSGRPYPWMDCGSGSVSGQESRSATVGSSVSRFELAFSVC